MKKYMILFSVGKDRPGIVDDVSTLLFERGANIEDSRMAAMGGRFSIMTLFSCPTEQLEDIRTGLDDLRKKGLETSLHEAEDPTASPAKPALPIKFGVMSMDHPGVVQKVVHLLHQHNVNIRTLNTQVTRAPLSGAPLFDLVLEADVPVEKPIPRLKNDLMELAAQMNLDLSFRK
jgi:glycine cleavage system transcriptional repressor